MPRFRADPPQANAAVHVTAPPARALELLLQAYASSRALKRDLWDFAVEIDPLRAAGLTNTHLRWLLCQGYAVHAEERSRAGEQRRRFRPVANLKFSRRTCVVLTEAGFAYAQACAAPQTEAPPAVRPHPRPLWDAARRELWLGPQLVKRFKQPAANQELVLAAFQEEGWPPRIFDPLPPVEGQDGKRRLHSTINNLNRGHEHWLLRFQGGGDGISICWQLVARRKSETRARPERV